MSKVPKLRFPEFKGEWEEKKVIDTFKIISIRNIQIKNSEIKEKGKYKVVDQGKDLVAGFSDKNNTFKNVPVIIFGDHTTIIKYIDFEFIVGADGVKILTNKDSSNNLKYLFYNLQQNNVEQEGYKRHFTLLSERYLQIPLEQNEQQKIADCLSSLDELIEARREKIASLKAYKKGLLQQLFPQEVYNNYPPHPLIFSKLPKLRFAGFEGEWEEVKLGEIGVFLSSLTGKTKEDFDKGNAKYIPYINVYKNTFIDIHSLGKVNIREEEKQNVVKKGDILFTISSETPEEAGMSSVLADEIKDCYVNSFCSLFRFNSLSDKNIYFYGYLLRHHTIREYFRKTAQGSTRFNLSKESFKNLSLLVSKLDEQQKIADCLLSLDEKIAAEMEQVTQLQQHKKGLLQQLLV